MLPAAEERSSALTSGEEIFSLAAGVALAALELHQGARKAQGKKPHQGVFPKNRGNHVGEIWAKWSGTHQDRKCWWSKTVSGTALDANGNTLSDPQGRSFTWDFENRLTQVVNPGVGTTTFRYDPFGRRIQKSGPLGTTNYLYDGLSMVDEIGSDGSVVARYSQSTEIDEPLSEFRSATVSYYEQDGVRSVSSLTNSSSAIVGTYTYDSFGTLNAFTGNGANPFRFSGREYDPEIGHYYYRARYYDSSNGRFFSEDPLLFDTGAPYFYAWNSPANFTDKTGLAPGDWWDPRTPGNVWSQSNPFNPNGAMWNTATSIGDSISGIATGNWSQVANAYDYGPMGQTANGPAWAYYGERASVTGAGAAAGAAATLMALEATGVTDIGETTIDWRGGEIRFTRPGCKTPDFRINPFGDWDNPNKLSKRPHYHRRPGIGKHRPWEGW
jgi:RHS repeat-associated protein